MFADGCTDVMQCICMQLEACDILELMKTNKRVRACVSPLLVGAVINKREMVGNVLSNVSIIPLLNIRESTPLCIMVGKNMLCVRRLSRVVELNAEMFCIFMPPFPRCPYGRLACVYVVDDCVKHVIYFSTIDHAIVVRTRHPSTPHELQYLFDNITDTSAAGPINIELATRLHIAFGIGDAGLADSEDEVRLMILRDLHVMSSRCFMRFIVRHRTRFA